MKAVRFFETPGSNYPAIRNNNTNDLRFQYENSFATSKILQHCHFQQVMLRASRMTLVVSFDVVFFLSLAYWTSDQTSGCSIGPMPWRRGREFKWTLLRNNIGFSLSLLSNLCVCVCLSLSLSLSHTHTHKRFKRRGMAETISHA
jgi:hypothetical protein